MSEEQQIKHPLKVILLHLILLYLLLYMSRVLRTYVGCIFEQQTYTSAVHQHMLINALISLPLFFFKINNLLLSLKTAHSIKLTIENKSKMICIQKYMVPKTNCTVRKIVFSFLIVGKHVHVKSSETL